MSVPTPEYSASALAHMAERLAAYFESPETPNGYGWLRAEARMFRKQAQAEVETESTIPERLSDVAQALSSYYARERATSWAYQLKDEAKRIRALEEDAAWEETLSSPESLQMLDQMAQEALEDHRQGRTEPMECGE